VTTSFIFAAENSGEAEIRIYTLLGGLVWSSGKVAIPSGGQLYDGLITWNGKNNADNQVLNGVYIAILKIDGKTFKTKVAFVK
jgi:hypothetical protein